MEEELNTVVESNSEDTVESTKTEKEVEQASDFIAPSEEEYKKALQSAASKAKYELLKEMGVKDVKEFKEKYSTYESAIKDRDILNTKLNEQEVQIKKLNKDLVMEQLHVNEDFKDDLVTLAESKVSDTVDFKTACQEVLEKNPNWSAKKEPIKMGTEKSEPTPTDELNAKLASRYPWIK